MSDLRKWWGGTKADHLLLVAKDEATAAKIAGVRQSIFPFKFRPSIGPLPYGVSKPGLYRNVGGAGRGSGTSARRARPTWRSRHEAAPEI